MAEHEFLRRRCDYCDEVQDFSKQELPPDQKKAEAWITLARVFIVDQQTMPVFKHACRLACAENILRLGMLDLPKEIKDMLEARARGPRPVAGGATQFAGVEVQPTGA